MPTYKHNDYYGYINKIIEKAISNPEGFGGNSEDANQAYNGLNENGGKSIINEIYNNTPEEIQLSIPTKKLTKEQRESRVTDYQRKKTNEAANKVALGAASTFGAPLAISNLAIAPATTIGTSLGGSVFGGILGNIGNEVGKNIYSRKVLSDGTPVISTNGKLGTLVGGTVGGTIGGIMGGIGGNSSVPNSTIQNLYNNNPIVKSIIK